VPAIGGSKGRKNQKATPMQQLSIAVIETPAELKQLASKKNTKKKQRQGRSVGVKRRAANHEWNGWFGGQRHRV